MVCRLFSCFDLISNIFGLHNAHRSISLSVTSEVLSLVESSVDCEDDVKNLNHSLLIHGELGNCLSINCGLLLLRVNCTLLRVSWLLFFFYIISEFDYFAFLWSVEGSKRNCFMFFYLEWSFILHLESSFEIIKVLFTAFSWGLGENPFLKAKLLWVVLEDMDLVVPIGQVD